jgi:hypothetical protein
MNTISEPVYIGTYKVFRVSRKTAKRTILAKNLSIDEAKRLVNAYPYNKNTIINYENMKTFKNTLISQKSDLNYRSLLDATYDFT